MVKREIAIHCPTYLLKYLQKQYSIEHTVSLGAKFVFNMPTNSQNVANYFERYKEEGQHLIIYMWNPSLRKAFAFCKAMEFEFTKNLISFVDGYVRAGASAKEAVQLYFDRYHITEYDYKFETAYKKWVRRDKTIYAPQPLIHAL